MVNHVVKHLLVPPNTTLQEPGGTNSARRTEPLCEMLPSSGIKVNNIHNTQPYTGNVHYFYSVVSIPFSLLPQFIIIINDNRCIGALTINQLTINAPITLTNPNPN